MPADITGGSDFDMMQRVTSAGGGMEDQLRSIDVEVDIRPREGAMKEFVGEYLKGMEDAKSHVDKWANDIGSRMREIFKPHTDQLGNDLQASLGKVVEQMEQNLANMSANAADHFERGMTQAQQRADKSRAAVDQAVREGSLSDMSPQQKEEFTQRAQQVTGATADPRYLPPATSAAWTSGGRYLGSAVAPVTC